MRKPKNRKERIDFLMQKLGLEFVRDLYALTDKQIKALVEQSYNNLVNKDDYTPVNENLICIRCNSNVETEFHTYCGCGTDRAIYNDKMWEDDINNNNNRVYGDKEFLENKKILNE